MLKYLIFIPTYKRPHLIKSLTLKLLEEYNIPKNIITLFIEDENMKDEYFLSLGNDYNYVVTNTKGIMEKRNFMEYYAYDLLIQVQEPINILYIDDDIKKILDYDSKLNNLQLIINLGFRECIEKNLNIWGVSLCTNPFFLQKKITYTNKYICAGFFGYRYTLDKLPLLVDVGHGEDFQRSMEAFLRDGGLIRFNWIALETKNYNKVGGICESLGSLEKRKKEAEENLKYLCNRYGSMCRLIYKKKTGYDLRLNNFFTAP